MNVLKPIDSILLISAAVFVSSCIILRFGASVGPCGPSSSLTLVAMGGAPIGGLGMIIGFIFTVAYRNQDHNQRG